jgi:hypothetical protein
MENLLSGNYRSHDKAERHNGFGLTNSPKSRKNLCRHHAHKAGSRLQENTMPINSGQLQIIPAAAVRQAARTSKLFFAAMNPWRVHFGQQTCEAF